MLDGVRILDLSRLLPGPACASWLRGQGAVVDRVEAPGRGDFTRHIPPYVPVEGGEVGAYFAATSRGVRSVAVDLRHADGIALVRRLAPRYDVLLEGFRPGVLEAMGLGPDVLHAEAPGLVIARLSGYGQTGPWASRVGHDVNYLGLSGALSAQAEGPRGLALPTVQVADMAGALVAAAGICAALAERARTGRGRVLDVSLAEAALWVASPLLAGATGEGVDPGPGEHLLSGGLPVYGTFRCADGRWLTLGALEPKFQQALVARLDGDLGVLDHPVLAARLATQPRDHWVEALQEVCAGPALAPSEVADHPQHAARGAAVRQGAITWVRPPLGELPDGGVPALGAHTDVVLGEAGVDAGPLRAAGAVA